MQPTSRIPPLLQDHTRLPDDDSLILATSILGASANWLLIRFLCQALQQHPELKPSEDNGADSNSYAVILVSWLRDWEFWKSEGRKAGGLDLQRCVREDRLRFVDALSALYLPRQGDTVAGSRTAAAPSGGGGGGTTTTINAPARMGVAGRPTQTVLPVRAPLGTTIPARGSNTASTTIPPPPTTTTAAQNPPVSENRHVLSSPSLEALESTVQNAISSLHQSASTTRRKILLILDSPGALLAMEPSITPSSLCSAILRLHAHATHVLVHLSADDALLAPSNPPQPLEVEGHNLLVKMAHMSNRVLSCRVLDTGVARDVSGVLRVTGGGGGDEPDSVEGRGVGKEEEQGRELLYLVKGDGSVKVFERGSGET